MAEGIGMLYMYTYILRWLFLRAWRSIFHAAIVKPAGQYTGLRGRGCASIGAVKLFAIYIYYALYGLKKFFCSLNYERY